MWVARGSRHARRSRAQPSQRCAATLVAGVPAAAAQRGPPLEVFGFHADGKINLGRACAPMRAKAGTEGCQNRCAQLSSAAWLGLSWVEVRSFLCLRMRALAAAPHGHPRPPATDLARPRARARRRGGRQLPCRRALLKPHARFEWDMRRPLAVGAVRGLVPPRRQLCNSLRRRSTSAPQAIKFGASAADVACDRTATGSRRTGAGYAHVVRKVTSCNRSNGVSVHGRRPRPAVVAGESQQ